MTSPSNSIEQAFADGTVIEQALRAGVAAALLRHRQMGLPIVVWQDGRVVWIPSDQIPTNASAEDGRDAR